MKRLLILFCLFFVFSFSFSQGVIVRTNGVATVSDGRLIIPYNFFMPRYLDTVQANNNLGIDTCGAIIFTYTGNAVWSRSCSPKRWERIGTGGSSGNPDTIYTALPLYVDTVSDPPKRILKILHADGIVSPGYVTKAGCWTLDVTSALYYIGFRQFVSPSSTVGIDTSDATYGRIDLVIVDTNAIVSVLKGTPSATPVSPTINPSSQLVLSTISVPAGASCLSAQIEIVYDEHIAAPTEWTPTSSGTLSVDYDNTDNPEHLTKAAFVATYTNGSKLIFTKSGTDTLRSGQILKSWVYLNGALGTNNLQYQFFFNSIPASNALSVNSSFGLNPLDSNNYQNVSIPLYAFNFTRNTFNKLVITFGGSDISGAKGLYVDYVQLQTGNSNIDVDFSNKVDSVTKSNDSLFYWVKGLSTFIGTVGSSGTGGISHAVGVNGLSNVNDSTIQLGGTLLANTTVATGTNTMSFSGSSTNITLSSTNSTSGFGISGNSVLGVGVGAASTSGVPLQINANTTTNNTVQNGILIYRTGSGAGSGGLGAAIETDLSNTTPSTTPASKLITTWTTATAASETSKFAIQLKNTGAVLAQKLGIAGSGALTLDGYASGALYHNDTTNYKPVVIDNSGNVFQGNWVGSSGGTPLTSIFNIGSGFRLVKPTDTVKTLINGYAIGIDSSSNTNALTFKVDTSLIQRALSLGAIGSVPNANGLTLSNNTLNLQKVNASFGGVLTTGYDSISGAKYFTGRATNFLGHTPVLSTNFLPTDKAILDSIDNGKYNTSIFIDWLPTGELANCYLQGTRDGGGRTTMFLGRSNDQGQTWANRDTIINSPIPTTVNAGGGGIANSGRMIVFYSLTDTTNGLTPISLNVIYSDNYTTWSSPIVISQGSNTYFVPYGRLSKIANDTLMLSWYGSVSGTYTSYVIKSGDNGLTWGSAITVLTSGSLQPTESSFTYLGGNVIVGIIRNNIGQMIQALSQDNGSTWASQGNITAFSTTNGDMGTVSTYASGTANRVVEAIYSQRSTGKLLAIYAKSQDIITSGVSAWNTNTLTTIATNTPSLPDFYPVSTHYQFQPSGICAYLKYKSVSSSVLKFVKLTPTLVGAVSDSAWSLYGNSTTANTKVLGTTNNTSLRFITNNTQKVIFDSTGKVGIGTLTPSYPLHVSGVAAQMAIEASSGAEVDLNFIPNGGVHTWQFGANSTGFYNYDAGAGKYRLILDQSGNYAMGGDAAISPVFKSVGTASTFTGSVTAPTSIFTTSTQTPLISGGTTTTSSITYKTTSGVGTTGADHIFQVGNNGATEAMRILNNGNVGIGTSAPSVPFHVKGVAAQMTIESSSGNEVDLNLIPGGGNATYILGAYASGFYIYQSGGTGPYRFTISQSGQIGIGGITVPTSRLHLPAGSATANFSPLKFTSGTNLTAIENGAVEYNGSRLFVSSNSTRQNIQQGLSGSFSQVGTATTVFTVTFGGTQPNATYQVSVTPTDVLAAALFYVTNKTTTTFDVTYLTGLTGTATFDWVLTQ